jgi:hypothetical protein
MKCGAMEAKKKMVNYHWLSHIFGTLTGGADDDLTPWRGINANNEESVIKLVSECLRPDFYNLKIGTRLRLKETFRYALNFYSDSDLKQAFESALPPFRTPDDIRLLYQRIWREMFEGESFEIQDASQYQELNDRKISILK